MAAFDDAIRIGLALPETTADEDGVGVRHNGKIRGMAWRWKERVEPKQPRVPNQNVLAIRTAGLDEKDLLIQADPEKFFTEPHYNNYPAVLVRLPAIDDTELEELLTEAWRALAPKPIVRQYDADRQ